MCSICEAAQDRQSRALFERLAERLGEMLQDIETTITAGTKLSARWEQSFGCDAILHCLIKYRRPRTPVSIGHPGGFNGGTLGSAKTPRAPTKSARSGARAKRLLHTSLHFVPLSCSSPLNRSAHLQAVAQTASAPFAWSPSFSCGDGREAGRHRSLPAKPLCEHDPHAAVAALARQLLGRRDAAGLAHDATGRRTEGRPVGDAGLPLPGTSERNSPLGRTSTGSAPTDRPREAIGDAQDPCLIRFKSYFLGKHDIAQDQAAHRNEAPSFPEPPVFVDLVDVAGRSQPDAVPLSGIAPHDVEISFPIEFDPLLGRKPRTQQSQRSTLNRFLLLCCLIKPTNGQAPDGPRADANDPFLHRCSPAHEPR
ncbi:hypothetical protein ABIA40_000595 [Bradyrhizobium sp. USDA 223]